MKKLSLLLVFALVLMSAVVPTSALAADSDSVWLETKCFNFNTGYSATESNPAYPSGVNYDLGSSKVSAVTIDDSHGVSLNVNATGGNPWFAVETRNGNDKTKETSLLKYKFEFYAKSFGSGFFHGLGQKGDNSGNRDFNNFIQLQADGSINYLNGAKGTYETEKWYTVEIIVDIPNQTYTINLGKTGSTLPTVVDGATLKNAWLNVVSFRFTNHKGSNLVYDNIYTYKSVSTPKVTKAEFNKTNNTINVTFNKDMNVDSFTSSAVTLKFSSEDVDVPFTGEYADRVYTITLSDALPENGKYTLEISGVKCTDGLEITDVSQPISVSDKYIADSNVVFSSSATNVTASVTVPESVSSSVKKLVLGAYKGDMLVGYDIKNIDSAPSGAISLSAKGTDIDGAAVYALNSDLTPVCDAVIMEGSKIKYGARNTVLPTASAKLDYDALTDTVKVYGKANRGDMITVISNSDQSASLTDISALRQTVAKENGYWEISFVNDTSKNSDEQFKFPSGDYNVHVLGGSSAVTLPYKYSNSAESKAAMVDVQTADSKDDIEKVISDYKKIFALDLTEYNTLDKDGVHGFLLTEPLSSYTEGAQFKAAFERSVFLQMLSTDGFDWADVEKYSGVFDADTSEIDDTDFIVEILKSGEYADKGDFPDKLDEAVMLSKISNAANSAKMKALVLDTYDDELDLPGDSTIARKYDKINEQSKVFSKMLLDDDERYYSVDDVTDAFEDAVKAIYENENKKKSSGGSGGGSKTYVASVPSVPETVTEKPVFTDVSVNDNEVLKALSASGIVAGYGDGTFRPQGNVRRDEFMKMLVVALGLEDGNAVSPFDDVPVGNWAYSYVAAAYNAGITTGVSATEFAPASNINRQDVITMIYRACKDRGLISSADTAGTADTTGVADYAVEAVGFVYGNITSADADGIRPAQPATRIETANLLYDFIEYVKGGK